jgi:leader peptidase (prepilin peptidase)/N-methyltransferase
MSELLSALQPHAAWVGGLLGLILGSFLNVVIHRMPLIMERQWQQDAAKDGTDSLLPHPHLNLATPASHCPQCGHRLDWWENLPVLSFLLLKGRCHACLARIGWRYPAIELFTALSLGACFQHWGLSLQAIVWAGFVCSLLALAVIDWDTTLLPDHITQPLIWAGLIVASLGLSGLSLSNALWGAVAGYLSLWLVYWLFKLITGKEGMGYGDFKLFAALGAWFGWAALTPLILLASLAGIAVGLVLQSRQQLREKHYIPFGPFLAMAAGVYLIWGEFFTRLGWA